MLSGRPVLKGCDEHQKPWAWSKKNGVAQLEYDLCDDPLLLNFKKLKAYGLELMATAPSGQDVKQSFTSLAKRDDGASALSSRLGAARSRDARRASDASWSLPTAEGRRSPPGLAGESLQALSSSTTSLLRSVRPVLRATNRNIRYVIP